MKKKTTNKAPRPLTRKQKAFADELIKNPKISATQAALKHYGSTDKPTTYATAADIAHSNLNKPQIQIYLDKHIEKAKSKIVSLIDSEREDIALRASDSVLDRALGKAVQKTETKTLNIEAVLDLN